jgi:phospholipid transport system substrate-binding protein
VLTGRGADIILIDDPLRLVNPNGAYKINDIIIEGISMAVTQRSEFAAVVQRNGGQVRGLIALMREKTASAAH